MIPFKKGDKKVMNAWAFYDWANSVYPLVISSAIFPIYYGALFKINKTDTILFFGSELKNTALIGFVTAAAFLVVAVFSPILSGIADYVGNKKVFMQFFCYLGALSCVGLAFFSIENIYFGIACYFFGLIGFWGSLVFYNSYLPDIAFENQQDKLSAKGFSLGYAGSVLLLILNLAMVMKPEWFAITGDDAKLKAMKYSFVSVGIWWVVFSQYTFYYLPNGNNSGNKLTRQIVFNGFRELKKVWQLLQQNQRLKKYLTAFFVYSMAVQTVMLMATYFGATEIEWTSEDEGTIGLIISILIIQLVAVLGAVITSKASEKFGNLPTLIAINAIWTLVCIWAYFVHLPMQFYITATLVGLVMGGVQALSRSTFSKFLPETNDTASFFSFYDVAEKIGIVIGMSIYGTINQITGSMRNSIVFLAVFFVIGLILLLQVPKTNTNQ